MTLADADPVPAVISFLSSHPSVVGALGGPRVSGHNRPPYPCIRVLDPPGGDDRSIRWLIARYVQVEALGDLDGSPGKAALARILYTALEALADLPYAPPQPGWPVITAVESASAVAWAPEPSGQPRYVAGVVVSAHPPN